MILIRSNCRSFCVCTTLFAAFVFSNGCIGDSSSASISQKAQGSSEFSWEGTRSKEPNGKIHFRFISPFAGMRLADENVRELNTELVVLDKQFRRLIQLDDVKNKIDNGLLTVDCTANELASKSKYIEISTNIEFKESGLIDRGNFGGLYVNRIAIDQIKNLTWK